MKGFFGRSAPLGGPWAGQASGGCAKPRDRLQSPGLSDLPESSSPPARWRLAIAVGALAAAAAVAGALVLHRRSLPAAEAVPPQGARRLSPAPSAGPPPLAPSRFQAPLLRVAGVRPDRRAIAPAPAPLSLGSSLGRAPAGPAGGDAPAERRAFPRPPAPLPAAAGAPAAATGSPVGSALALLERGEQLENEGHCAEAIGIFSAMTGQPGNDPLVERALIGRARCRLDLGQNADAVRDLKGYLSRFPSGEFATEAQRLLGGL